MRTRRKAFAEKVPCDVSIGRERVSPVSGGGTE